MHDVATRPSKDRANCGILIVPAIRIELAYPEKETMDVFKGEKKKKIFKSKMRPGYSYWLHNLGIVSIREQDEGGESSSNTTEGSRALSASGIGTSSHIWRPTYQSLRV